MRLICHFVTGKVYDEVIDTLHTAINRAKLGAPDKHEATKTLHTLAKRMEKNFVPNDNFDPLIEKERNDSWM